jgi:ATP-dependent helicase/nuclease subunit A
VSSLTEQQQKAVETIDKHVLVCAGAGSGKTHVLIERFIEILKKNEDVSVAHLVAVTFTRKAAVEMRNRLKTKFKQLVDEAGENTERWQSCLGEVDGARIGTIHSLCEFIIKSFPVEAGIDPQFEVLDDLGQAELLSESIDQSFREVIAGAATEQKLFEDFDLDIIRQLVIQGIRGSSRFIESLHNFPINDEPKLALHLEHHIKRARKICLAQLIQNAEWQQNIPRVETAELPSGNKLESYRKEFLESSRVVESLTKGGKPVDELVDAAWAGLCTIAGQTPRTTGGPDGKGLRDLMKGVRELCKGFAERISPTLVSSDQDALRCISALVSLIQRTMDIYEERKRLDLLLDFNDLIALAFSALKRDNSAAARFFNENTHTLLVDEFQDTNTVQSDLLALIAGKKAKYFLIGDDKQSIYRFQGADVSTFNTWRRRFDSTEEAVTLSLSDSFRSHPELVAFVNIVFAALMVDAGDDESHRAVFERLKAARTDEDSGRIEMLVCQPDFDAVENDPDAPRRMESQAVADWIQSKIAQKCTIYDKHQGLQREVALGDFAVLVPRNSDFAYFERAMSDRSMPYVVVSGKGYLDRQEILDLENLMRFLASPRDNHALVAALRSPMFALSDDLLHQIAIDGGTHRNDSLWRKMRGYEQRAETSSPVLSRAVALLENFLLQSKLLPLSALVRTIILQTHYDLILLSVPNGLQRSRNIWKLVALAGEKEQCSCGEFAEMLARMREVGVKLSDAPTDDSNAVKLMTIHASKGLEFPYVALPVLSARNAVKSDRLMFHKDYGLAFNTARTEEDQTPTWLQACKVLDEDMELAEKKRLFYVAMTRARDSLGLFVHSDGGDKNTFKSWLLESLQIDQDDLYVRGLVKQLRHGSDTASLSIVQYEPENKEDSGSQAESENQTAFGDQAESGVDAETAAEINNQAEPESEFDDLVSAENIAAPEFEFEEFEREEFEPSPQELDARQINESLELDESRKAQHARGLIARLNQATASSAALDLQPKQEVKMAAKLPKISDVQSGVAVVADESGQMKFLFAQELDVVCDDEVSRTESMESNELGESVFALSDLPIESIEATEPTEATEATDTDRYTEYLLEPLQKQTIALPSSWQGSERVTSKTDQPLFSATLLGTFFHSLMENIPSDGRLMTQSEVEAIAFSQSGVIPLPQNLKALVQHGMDLLRKFYDSSFFVMFIGAKRRLHELPYLYNTADGATCSRRPDLVLEQGLNQWLLVDYKTDHFDRADLMKHTRDHSEQLQTYVKELNELLGVNLKAYVYYAQYGLLQECLD